MLPILIQLTKQYTQCRTNDIIIYKCSKIIIKISFNILIGNRGNKTIKPLMSQKFQEDNLFNKAITQRLKKKKENDNYLHNSRFNKKKTCPHKTYFAQKRKLTTI